MIGAIFAGGDNRRMPFTKGLLTVDGRTIMERSIETMGRVFDRVVVSTNMPEKYFRFNIPLIGDVRRGRGPMAGILSVLVATGEDSVFAVACDMPFINEALIRYMVRKFGIRNSELRPEIQNPKSKNSSPELPAHDSGRERVDAVIPFFGGREQPLLGIYASTVIKSMETLTEQGQTGLADMLKALRVLYITEEEVRGIDRHGEAFININTMEDYEKIGGKTCLA